MPDVSHPIGRRAFIRRAASALAAGAAADLLRSGLDGRALAAPARPNARARVIVPRDNAVFSTVVDVHCKDVLTAQTIHTRLLADMFADGLRTLTGTDEIRDAWHKLLRPDDIIGIKFNISGAEALGTTPALAVALVDSLVDAGWDPRQIVLLEETRSTNTGRTTTRPRLAYSQAAYDFGCGSDSFVGFVDQVSAIINVPFLKTHDTAFMTASLKNLSHGLVRHPARFHADGCQLAIPSIVASPPIRSRLRLNVINAIRVVYDHGPAVRENCVAPAGHLFLSTDPVAADSCAFDLLNVLRAARKLPPIMALPQLPRQLVLAQKLGLGQADAERIVRRIVEV